MLLLVMALCYITNAIPNQTYILSDINVLTHKVLTHLTTQELFKITSSTNKLWYHSAIHVLSNRTKELSLKQLGFILYKAQYLETQSSLEQILSKYKQEIGQRSAMLSSLNRYRRSLSININTEYSLISITHQSASTPPYATVCLTMQRVWRNESIRNMTTLLDLELATSNFYILVTRGTIIFIMHTKNIFGQFRITESYVFQPPSTPVTSVVKLRFLSKRPNNGRIPHILAENVARYSLLQITDIHLVNDPATKQLIESQMTTLRGCSLPEIRTQIVKKFCSVQ